MKKNYCHIVVVLDRSGSMGACKTDTIKGFNNFIKDQKKVGGESTVTLVQFDDLYEVNYQFLPIKKVEMLNETTYVPRGYTALWDAIGKTIVTTGESLNAMDESKKPDKVLFIIQTDGLNNASTEYNPDRLKEMIEHQQNKYSWEFVFLGAGQDAILEAQQYGIRSGSSLSYNVVRTQDTFSSLCDYATKFRSANVGSKVNFTDKDRENAKG